MNDEELIYAIRNGDDEAFIKVVDTYKKKVIGLCNSYSKDYQEAEDLSQEVFISFYNSINNFRGDCSISTYIYKISVSKCLDFKRKKSIKNFLTGFIGEKRADYNDSDEKIYIRQCVNALNEDLKLPVVLYYYLGLSQKEIGQILGITPKNVEGRIYRAKQKLRIELKQGGELQCKWSETV